MSLDMRMLVSVETADSEESESMAVGLVGHLDAAWRRLRTIQPHTSPLPQTESCRLPIAACSPVNEENADRVADPVPGAGRLLVGSIESPELIISLV
jgi:hypothetical protein